MPLFMIFLMVSTGVFAAEVATLETNPFNKNEIVLIVTEPSFQDSFEKAFLASPCKARVGNNNLVGIRENGFPLACRAEITKYLLNNGYKYVDFRTFQK